MKTLSQRSFVARDYLLADMYTAYELGARILQSYFLPKAGKCKAVISFFNITKNDISR